MREFPLWISRKDWSPSKRELHCRIVGVERPLNVAFYVRKRSRSPLDVNRFPPWPGPKPHSVLFALSALVARPGFLVAWWERRRSEPCPVQNVVRDWASLTNWQIACGHEWIWGNMGTIIKRVSPGGKQWSNVNITVIVRRHQEGASLV